MQSSLKLLLVSLSIAGATAAFIAHAADPTTAAGTEQGTALVPADKLFLDNAAIGGMTEIKAGELAEQKGTAEDIKAFGRKMVDDHTATAAKLTALAASKSVTLPTKLDTKHRAELATLQKSSGKAFDTAFIKAMKDGHAETIAQFDRAAASRDADVSMFARTTLPTLKEHAENIPGVDHSKM